MRTKEQQEAINAELARIAENGGGLLTPDAVVAEAAHKGSVLHALFEWDTKAAAHAFRIVQARALIRSVRVVVTNNKTVVSTVCYVRDPDVSHDEQGYCSTVSLIGQDERSRAALVNEFSRAASALRRARELAIAFNMVGEVDAVVESVETMRTKVEARVEQQAAA